MAKRENAKLNDKAVSLLVLEGDTEQVFYPLIQNMFLTGIRIELRNIRGRGNVNKDILSETYKYMYVNRHDSVRVYCCVDTERDKHNATPLDLGSIRERAKERGMNRLLSVNQVSADPDIESWFFFDIDGIYTFLRAKKSQRNKRAYRNPQNLCKKDLQRLFQKFGKVYLPGRRATHFIHSLDIAKIFNNCKALQEGIHLIRSQANDPTNHLLQTRTKNS